MIAKHGRGYHIVLDEEKDIHNGDIIITDAMKDLLKGETNSVNTVGTVRRVLHTEYSRLKDDGTYDIKQYLDCGHILEITIKSDERLQSSIYGIGTQLCKLCDKGNE